jgi:hypothetical protein
MSEDDYYRSNHVATDNYRAGMKAMMGGQPEEALRILLNEPENSVCRGLALVNAALAELRLERYANAVETGERALLHFENHGCPHPPSWVQAIRNIGEGTAAQGRHLEALPIFEEACELGERLIVLRPEQTDAIELERAHTYNSWGGHLLHANMATDAIECFMTARKLYALRPENTTGVPESLTNLAHAYLRTGDQLNAKLALEAAEPLAANNPDQLNRILIAKIQAGLISKEEARTALLKAGAQAEKESRFDTAYLRYCISAKIAHDLRDPIWGLEAIASAERIEAELGDHNLTPPKLRFYKAAFFEIQHKPASEILDVLLEGARLWCDRLPGPLALADYIQVVSIMHHHFNWLTQMLLDAERLDEAFIAFEVGRARAFAIQLSKSFDHPLVAANPFASAIVDCSLLEGLRQKLGEDEVVVSLAALRLEVVAFVVSREEVKVSRTKLSGRSEAAAFEEGLDRLAHHLTNAIPTIRLPSQLLSIARSIARDVSNRTIVLFAPHTKLHSVPWRAVLREANVPWSQLAFSMEFSPFLDPGGSIRTVDASAKCIALGFGTAGPSLSLEKEAEDVVNIFGSRGILVTKARSQDLIHALGQEATVLISCHGNVHKSEGTFKVIFDLQDGAFSVHQLLPDEIRAPVIIL